MVYVQPILGANNYRPSSSGVFGILRCRDSLNSRSVMVPTFRWWWDHDLRFEDEAKIDSTRLTLKEGSCNMSSRFFYILLKFTPKIRTHSALRTKQHGAVVEVPKDLVQRKQSEIINDHRSWKAIALDLARRAALGTFPTVEERVVGLYHEDAIWYHERPLVMNERPCDHEENGTRAWRIAVLPPQFSYWPD